MEKNILKVKNLSKYYVDQYKNEVKAVDDVTFSIKRGTIYALVGPSGCGKSTLAKTILKLISPTSGQALFNDINIFKLKEKEMRNLRPKMQIVFQNPYTSLNPRMKIGQIIKEGIIEKKIVPKQEVESFFLHIIKECEIDPALLERYPHQLSGGERQRVAIARALALKPEFVIADEMISSLDKPISKQILDLMIKLKEKHQITFLYISHDIASVKYAADAIGVMSMGKIIEQGTKEQILLSPKNEFTKSFLKNEITTPFF